VDISLMGGNDLVRVLRSSDDPGLQSPITINYLRSFVGTGDSPLPAEEAFTMINDSILGYAELVTASGSDKRPPQMLAKVAQGIIKILIEDSEIQDDAFDSLIETLKAKGLHETAKELRELTLDQAFENYFRRILAD
jgi:hypothetical protein